MGLKFEDLVSPWPGTNRPGAAASSSRRSRGHRYINDSKATNLHALETCLKSQDYPVSVNCWWQREGDWITLPFVHSSTSGEGYRPGDLGRDWRKEACGCSFSIWCRASRWPLFRTPSSPQPKWPYFCRGRACVRSGRLHRSTVCSAASCAGQGNVFRDTVLNLSSAQQTTHATKETPVMKSKTTPKNPERLQLGQVLRRGYYRSPRTRLTPTCSKTKREPETPAASSFSCLLLPRASSSEERRGALQSDRRNGQ